MKAYKSYLPIISTIRNVLSNLPSPRTGEQTTLITLWSGPGGGKSTMLNLIAEYFSPLAVVVGPWDLAHDKHSRETGKAVLSYIEKLHGAQKRIVLFDNTDWLFRCSDSCFFDFEANVLYKLIATNTLVIVTSRVPLICWKNHDVRTSSCNIHIPPLSQDEVIEWSNEKHLDPEKVWRISHGYPVVMSWLQKEPDLHPEALDRKIDAFFLGDMDTTQTRLAMVASRLPSFDLAVLRLSLQEVFPDKGLSLDDLHAKTKSLVSRGLLFWDTNIGAYRFRESTVRYLVAMRFLRGETGKSMRVHQVAADYYQKMARMGSCLHWSLANAVYHMAQIHSWKPRQEEVVEWVEKMAFGGSWLDASRKKVLESWKTGNGDEEMLRELQWLLGEENIRRITQILEFALPLSQDASQLGVVYGNTLGECP